MDRNLIRALIVISLFAIAMGLLESAVVIYLRDILYPGGFAFPLNPVREDLVWTEMLRELATLIMLLGVGLLAGRNSSERFAWFLYAFAVWDIFYYVFLRILVGWPESLLTWDVLFLLPVTWTGPVITPLIVSATMIAFALLIVFTQHQIPGLSWILLVAGSVILITAFTWDYSKFILEKLSFKDIWTLPGTQVRAMIYEYIPRRFNWLLFGLGEAIVLSGILVYRLRSEPVRHTE